MTISELEAAELSPNIVPREAAEKVLGYLVFHRSLLGEGEDSSKLLERYLALVEKLKEGVHVVIPDPFQKAMALLFELVMEEEFDPWEIDLVKFTQSYLERVESEGAVNFAIAGRLVYMAWSILYLQSEEVLKARALPDPALPDGSDASPGEEDGYLPLRDSRGGRRDERGARIERTPSAPRDGPAPRDPPRFPARARSSLRRGRSGRAPIVTDRRAPRPPARGATRAARSAGARRDPGA